MKFNNQQQSAIDYRGKSILVSASAGSGKTTILVERLKKRIIEEKISIDQICAITFTSKAAAEMKNRLSKVLVETLNSFPNDAHLLEQILLVPNAQISTIHSFCLSIIKEFSFLLEEDPQRFLTVFTESQIRSFQEDALDEVIEKLNAQYAHNPKYIELLNFFDFKIINFKKFKEAIIKYYQNLNKQLNFEDALQKQIELYNASSISDYDPNLIDFFKRIIQAHVSEMLDILIQLEPTKNPEKFDAAYSIHHSNLSSLLENPLENFQEKVLLLANTFFPTGTFTPTPFKPYHAQHLNALLNYALAPQDLTSIKGYVELMIDAVTLFKDNFEQKKREMQGVSFDDIEQFAYQILTHPSQLAQQTLQNRFVEIMVDEFQDTNLYQNAIVDLISRGNNVFRVGDVKQSIYRFRSAKPSLMIDLSKLENDDHTNIELTHNYRSSYNIIHFVNLLFERLMNIKYVDSLFNEKDIVSIGKEDQAQITDPVEIHLIKKQQEVIRQIDYFNPTLTTLKNPEAVAYAIAQDISTRDTQYKDISILLRNRTSLAQIEKALDHYNIPYYSNSKEKFYQSYSIQDILRVILFVHNPDDDQSVFWLLASGFINISENEIAQIRLFNRKQSLYQNMMDMNHPSLSILNTFIDLFEQYSTIDFMNSILLVNQYYDQHLDLIERTNVDLLLQLLHQYLSTQNEGLLGFVKLLNDSYDDEDTSSSAINENDDVVTIQTIHNSKGLEYPTTYFYGFKQDTKDRSLKESLLFDDDFGLILNQLNFEHLTKQRTLFELLVRDKLQLENALEEIRLLYVALTRAKNKLIIVDIERTVEFQKNTLLNLLKGDTYSVLLLNALDGVKDDSFVIKTIEQLDDIKATTKKRIKDSQDKHEFKVIQQPKLDPEYFDLKLNFSSIYATRYGSSIHQLIEKLPHTTWDIDLLGEQSDELIEKLLTYNQNPLTQALYQHSIEHEVSLIYKDQQDIQVGYIDFLARDDKTITIVDFKTDVVENEQILVERYQEQLKQYELGIQRQYPTHQVLTYLYSFHLNKYIEIN